MFDRKLYWYYQVVGNIQNVEYKRNQFSHWSHFELMPRNLIVHVERLLFSKLPKSSLTFLSRASIFSPYCVYKDSKYDFHRNVSDETFPRTLSNELDESTRDSLWNSAKRPNAMQKQRIYKELSNVIRLCVCFFRDLRSGNRPNFLFLKADVFRMVCNDLKSTIGRFNHREHRSISSMRRNDPRRKLFNSSRKQNFVNC